jgi:ribose transport system ATP-binding protein
VEFLEIRGLTRRFGGVLALDGVELSVRKGEVHSVIGENGAGKSTLLKVISGIVRADSGEVFFQGGRITNADPNRLFSLGISAAFQETSLFDNLTVAENLYLGRLYRREGPTIDWNAAIEAAGKAFKDFGLPGVDPRARVGELSAETRQVLEILKAVKSNAALISLDEPTAALTSSVASLLFSAIGKLRAKGITFLYVSHHLDEVLRVSDRITVFRDGRKVGTVDRAEATERLLHEMMIGRAVNRERRPSPARDLAAPPLLEVSGLGDGRKVHDVSFTVSPGEILGITGLIGAGRSELACMMVGLAPKATGTVRYEGKDVTNITPGQAIRQGISYLPEERRQAGLFLGQSLVINTTIARLEKVARRFRLDFRRERSLARETLQRLGVKHSDAGQAALSLSGGNQQKLLLAKCLFTEPRLLILDEPTKGIDVGSKEEIYGLVHGLAAKGMAVIVISSEVEEICLLSDRVLVMGAGRLIGSFSGEAIRENTITACYLQTAAEG